MAFSIEFRRAVAKAHDECGSSEEVAEQFGCSESWVRRLIQRRRETNSLEPRPAKLPDNSKLKEKELQQLQEMIARKPDMTLGELAKELAAGVSIPTIWRATRKLGLVLKKSPSMPPNKILRQPAWRAASGGRKSARSKRRS